MTLPESLRADWKALMLAHGMDGDQDNATRIHRVCKWFGEGQRLRQQDNPDMAFVAFWIGFNALYAQWEPDAKSNGYTPEFDAIRVCIRSLLKMDHGDLLAYFFVHARRDDIESVFANAYLSKHYWMAVDAAPNTPNPAFFQNEAEARRWRESNQLEELLVNFLGRVYVLRNQLIHGGATPSSGLNREQMMLVMPLMDRFLETVVRVVVNSNDPWHNWGKLPYPPQNRI